MIGGFMLHSLVESFRCSLSQIGDLMIICFPFCLFGGIVFGILEWWLKYYE